MGSSSSGGDVIGTIVVLALIAAIIRTTQRRQENPTYAYAGAMPGTVQWLPKRKVSATRHVNGSSSMRLRNPMLMGRPIPCPVGFRGTNWECPSPERSGHMSTEEYRALVAAGKNR